MKRLLLLTPILLCAFNYGYKNNPQTGKPDMVVTGATTSDISTPLTGVLYGNGSVISTATNAQLPSMSATVGGAVPTPPNDATKFLDGTGGFTIPPGTYVLPITDSVSTTSSTTAASATAVKAAYDLANGKLSPSGSAANLTSFPTLNQNTTGSAARLTTGQTLAITGPITYTSPSFDGSGNVTAVATVTAQTGTGSKFVMDTAPTFATNITLNGGTNNTALTGYREGTWTPVATGLTGTPVLQGWYTRIGQVVYCHLRIGGTSSASYSTTYFTGLPYSVYSPVPCTATSTAPSSPGIGMVYTTNTVYAPAWTSQNEMVISFFYITTAGF